MFPFFRFKKNNNKNNEYPTYITNSPKPRVEIKHSLNQGSSFFKKHRIKAITTPKPLIEASVKRPVNNAKKLTWTKPSPFYSTFNPIKQKPKENKIVIRPAFTSKSSLITAASIFGQNSEEFHSYNVNRGIKCEVRNRNLFIYTWDDVYLDPNASKVTYNYHDPKILKQLLDQGICLGGYDLWQIKNDKTLYEIFNKYRDYYDMELPFDKTDTCAYAIPNAGPLPRELVELCLSDRCPSNLPESIIKRCKAQQNNIDERPSPPFAEILEKNRMSFTLA